MNLCCGGAQRTHTRRALGGRACRSEELLHNLHAAYAVSCSLSISILSNGSPLARVLFVTLCLTMFELHGPCPCPPLDDSGHLIDGGACGSQGMLYTAFASRSRETYRV